MVLYFWYKSLTSPLNISSYKILLYHRIGVGVKSKYTKEKEHQEAH